MLNRCRREVEELNELFEDWFTARLPDSKSNLDRVSSVLGDDFQLITPEGLLLTREDLIDQLRKSHGSQSRRENYRIKISNFDGRSLAMDGNIFLATYKEHQFIDDEEKVRLCSSIFRWETNAPNQVEWVHSHKVWI